MDPVADIKARLPVEDLVRQYCQLTKKGRNFVALCPFHNDSRPSMLVSPDKGIAYCFPCQKGGDIFSFYQLIENVDFPQALKELAERVGVTLESTPVIQNKDARERLRACLEAAQSLYRGWLTKNDAARAYLAQRGIPDEQLTAFEIGFAPDSFTETYESLLKLGFSRTEIADAGLAIQKDLADGRMYDRFRNRIMFPIRDIQGRMIGFGGRALGADDAKYLNSAETSLYHKSSVLYGLHQARDAIRTAKKVILVEGYFDVLACNRFGAPYTVATCGTALTEEHARLLQRYVDTVVLCMDQDKAGRDAAERAFTLLAHHGIQVEAITLPQKDPADSAVETPDVLRSSLESGAKPYLDAVFDEIARSDHHLPHVRREALARLVTLLGSIHSSVERSHYISRAAAALETTETAFAEDLAAARNKATPAKAEVTPRSDIFTAAELALGLLLLYPAHRSLLLEMIEPVEPFAAALYAAIKRHPDGDISVDTLDIEAIHRERAQIVKLYCEQHGFADWGENVSLREIRRNCHNANREAIKKKQHMIALEMITARKTGDTDAEQRLRGQFAELLKIPGG